MSGYVGVFLPFALSTFWPMRPIKIAEIPLMGVLKFVRPVLVKSSLLAEYPSLTHIDE